jgi:hypothetical protein
MAAPPDKPKRVEHVMTCKIYGWLRCRHCGLVNLRNKATEKALRQECPR